MATLNVPSGLLKMIFLKEASRAPISAISLMRALAEKTERAWQPGPGSIYYLTSELVSKGLVKKLLLERYPKYIITPKGREELEHMTKTSVKDVIKLIRILHLYSDTIEDEYLSKQMDNMCRTLLNRYDQNC
jgi:DNA-binding PadR family transcriptional regulator